MLVVIVWPEWYSGHSIALLDPEAKHFAKPPGYVFTPAPMWMKTAIIRTIPTGSII